MAVVPAGLLGYLTVWPTGQTQPVASTLNSLDGRIKSNAAIVPAGEGGRHQYLRQRRHERRAGYQRLLRSGQRSHGVSLLSHHPLPHCRYPQAHCAARRAIDIRRAEPHVSDSFGLDVQHSGIGAGVLAQLRGGSQRVVGICDGVAERSSAADHIDADRPDRDDRGETRPSCRRGAEDRWTCSPAMPRTW